MATKKNKKSMKEIEKEVLKGTAKKKSSTSKAGSSSAKGKVVATMKTQPAKKSHSQAKIASPKKKDQSETKLDSELEALLEDFELPKELHETPEDLAKLFEDDEEESENKPFFASFDETVDELGIPTSEEEKIIEHGKERVGDFDFDDTLDDYKVRTLKDYEGYDFGEDDAEFDPGHFRLHHQEDEEGTEDEHFVNKSPDDF